MIDAPSDAQDSIREDLELEGQTNEDNTAASSADRAQPDEDAQGVVREDSELGVETNKDSTAASSTSIRKAPMRHIRDRCDGKSKYGDSRPPLRPCLPPPCVKWCPSIFEQNPICKLAGSCGLIAPDNDRWRRILCSVGLASNFIGFCLTIVACCSISLDHDTLMRTAFSSGTTVSDNPNIPGIKIGIGLRGIAIRLPGVIRTSTGGVWTFDKFCNTGFKMGAVSYFGDGVCRGCADTSAGLVGTLIMSVITHLPNAFTDILRMYPNYDVNCQKMFGSFISLASMLLSLYTWQGYVQSCFAVFYEGIIPYDLEGFAISPEEFQAMTDTEKRLNILVRMDYDWRAGPGLICLLTATFLKCVDIVCNMAVPTPTITRNRKEQEDYEALEVQVEET